MKDHSLTNSDGVSGNRKVEFDSSSEVVAEVSPPGKRRNKAEVASEDNRGLLCEELHDRKVEQKRQMFIGTKASPVNLAARFSRPRRTFKRLDLQINRRTVRYPMRDYLRRHPRHQENIALVKLTGLPLQRWTLETVKTKDLSVFQGCAFIDNQGTTCCLTEFILAAGVPIASVIDHHNLQGEMNAEFIDLRPQIRATATIFAEYLQAGLLVLDSSVSLHIKCATALMHGLRSDPIALRQAQEEDFLAAAYLSRFYDPQLLNAVLQSSRSKWVMDAIERSLKHRTVQNNFSIAGIGYLRYDDRDSIPQAADFLVTEENVHTAVVYAIVHDKDEEIEVVIGSLRTNKLTLDPDEFIKEAFGQDAQGRFFGGGRSQAGGFEIPVGFLSAGNENSDYARLKWEVFDAQIKQKLLNLISPKDNPVYDH